MSHQPPTRRRLPRHLLLAITFAFCASRPSMADVAVQGFASRKALHNRNEKVILEGTLQNTADTQIAVTVECEIRKGVATRSSAGEVRLELAGNETKQVRFTWDPGDREYGFAAVLVLKDAQGKVTARSTPAVFEVCHDWRKVCRMASMCVYHDYFNPDSPNSTPARMAGEIKHLRAMGYNMVEFFGEWHPRLDNLTPQIEQWPYWGHEDPKASRTKRTSQIAGTKIKEWIRALQEAGIKVTAYIHTPTYTIHDESWRVYTPLTGKYTHYDGDEERIAWLDRNNLGVPNCLNFCREFGGKVAAAVQEYGWDGYFLDSYLQLAKYTAAGVDRNEQKLTSLSVGEVYAEGLRLLSSQVRPVKDNFVFTPNGLHHILAGIECFPSRSMFGPEGQRFPFPGIPDVGCNFFYEGQDPRLRANTPWQITRSLRAVREATGQPVWSLFTFSLPPRFSKNGKEDLSWTHRVESVKPFAAVILANGLGYWNHFGGNVMPRPEEDAVAAAIASYLRFAARYGQYIYDLDARWAPKHMLEVEAPDHVYWKGNAFRRVFDERTELTVHLVNFDRMYLAAKLWDPTRRVPPTVTDARVIVQLPPGSGLVDAFVISADGDQEPVAVPVTVAGGTATFTVPRLEYWTTCVARIAKGK